MKQWFVYKTDISIGQYDTPKAPKFCIWLSESFIPLQVSLGKPKPVDKFLIITFSIKLFSYAQEYSPLAMFHKVPLFGSHKMMMESSVCYPVHICTKRLSNHFVRLSVSLSVQ